MADAPAFGRWLKQRRHALDLTQDALAEQVGCSVETIRKLEAERTRASRHLAQRLAEHLALAPAEREAFVRLARAVGTQQADAAPRSSAVAAARTGSAPQRVRLPTPLTPLLGRTAEVAAVTRALERPAVRLVTLVGPPGIGKTRVSLQVAAGCVPRVADGVVFVALAPLREAALVIPAIAQMLGIPDGAGHSLTERLHTFLQGQRLLLVLDNCEQVVAAAPDVAALLQANPRLTVLATSRTPLHIAGEHQYAVPPLALPAHDQVLAPDMVGAYAAVQLFVARAQAVQHDFALTVENAGAVTAVCRQLDGLPLALELAAARVKLFPPPVLCTRLGHRLDLLTGGARDLPVRQQTLRTAITWSYDLLDERTQRLFAHLAVFAADFTVPAVEAVCRTDSVGPGEVLDGLQALLDASLIEPLDGDGGAPRFRMLETIRAYALERLAASSTAAVVRQQHAAYYLALAEAAARRGDGAAEAGWLEQVATLHDNLRVALQELHTQGNAEGMLRVCAAVWPFWRERGYHREGRQWLDAGLRLAPVPRAVRIAALHGAGWLAIEQSDPDPAHRCFEEILALVPASADQGDVAGALRGLGAVALLAGHAEEAERYFQQSLERTRAAGDQAGMGWSHCHLAWNALLQEKYREAVAQSTAAVALFRDGQNLVSLSIALTILGRAARAAGDGTRATLVAQEGLRLAQQIGNPKTVAYFLDDVALGAAAMARDDAAAQAHVERAARLWGAADALRERAKTPMDSVDQPAYDCHVAAARTRLSAVRWATAWAEGQALTQAQAVAAALDARGDEAAQAAAPRDAGPSHGPSRARQAPRLTAREVDVLKEVAEGATDQDVAQRLGLRPRTVTTYLTRIYAKLGVRTRTAAVYAAREQHLI